MDLFIKLSRKADFLARPFVRWVKYREAIEERRVEEGDLGTVGVMREPPKSYKKQRRGVGF